MQLSAEINFISLKPGSDETRVMYTRSDNEEFMSGDDTSEIIKLLFESFLQRFEENLQNKMRGSEFEFDGINFFYYNFNKTSIYRGGSYIDPPKWLKDKKSTINPKNNDYKCFQYAATLALNLNRIKKDPQRISKIKPKNLEITYKIKFIDSFRFMSSSLSKLVDNLSEGIHNNKCSDCKSNLDYVRITKNKKLLLKCFNCNIYYKKKFNNDLNKKIKNTYHFCNNYTTGSTAEPSYLERINKFVLLLRKGVYPYEYMDTWERFNEKLLPSKKDFYSNLNMEDISDIDYRHVNNVFKAFKLENLGDYHDLYVQSDTLLLADAFNNFGDMCIKEYELDPAHFLSLPGLAWQACLKKTNIELELLTDYDMLLMVEEGIRGGICHSIRRYAKANNKYMKNYNNEEPSYIQYLDANNLYGWAMSKQLPAKFKWLDNDKINEEFIKNYNENDKR